MKKVTTYLSGLLNDVSLSVWTSKVTTLTNSFLTSSAGNVDVFSTWYIAYKKQNPQHEYLLTFIELRIKEHVKLQL